MKVLEEQDVNIKERIVGWFNNTQTDYFSKFSNLWISFNVYYKAYYLRKRGSLRGYNDRNGINELKNSNEHYAILNDIIKKSDRFQNDLNTLIIELGDNPLKNMRDGNELYLDNELENSQEVTNDFYKQLIEILYIIRNNMFHGEKNIISERDQKLVELAYKILHKFMGKIVELDFTV